jgi:hypothetical protein
LAGRQRTARTSLSFVFGCTSIANRRWLTGGLAIYNKEAAAEGGYLERHTNPPGGLAKYYHDSVIDGPGAFVLNIENFDTFGDSMVRKLIAEIAALSPPPQAG